MTGSMNAAPILVLKFGGTSVADATAMRRVAEIVRAAGADGARPVVVTSAMSKVTDGLLDVVRRAVAGHVNGAQDVLEGLLARHRAAGAELLSEASRRQLDSILGEAAGNLTDLLRVVSRHPGTRRALEDEVVAQGEHLSSQLLALAMVELGLPAVWVDARLVVRTDDQHSRATPLTDEIEIAAQKHLMPEIERGRIPVLGGFIGSTMQGATTTLGRGGSDFSGALVGAAVRAKEIQIWTDVNGFLTADPRVVTGVRNIGRLSYAEAAELAYFGAKVLHPRTIAPAVHLGIPVRICNSREPDAPGTIIDDRREVSAQGIKAIAHKRGITIVQVTAARMLGAYGFLRALFEVFERHRTSVDIVATSEVSVSLTIDDPTALSAIAADLRTLGEVRIDEGYAIVCAVGEGLKNTAGIAGRVFGGLSGVNVALISQGASSTNLTFVVAERDVEDVVRQLHERFFGARASAGVAEPVA
jgi:aspartate kinase